MAKKDSDQNVPAAKSKKGKKKKGGCLIPIIILFVIILGVTAVIIFDLFGARTKYLSGILSNVPIIGSMLAPSEEETETVVEKTSAQYQSEIDDLNIKLDALETSLADEREKTAMYVKEIDRLREYENSQEQFRKDKELFDRMVAENNPNAYIQFYESMSPENQWELYKESVVGQQKNTELSNYIKTVENMDGSTAAKMMEQMIPADLDLVVLVLRNVKADIRGEILGGMSAENAAIVYKRMAPEQ